MTGSTFINNSADSGGGLYTDGGLIVLGSTFANNSSTHDGGAITYRNDATFGSTGLLLIDSCAITGNRADRIVGNADDDILIAGVYLFEDDATKLDAIMQEWTRTDKAAEERVINLRNGDGLNGSVVLDATTVFNDADADVMTGSSGYDWFLFDPARDRVTDLHDEAFTDDLDFING